MDFGGPEVVITLQCCGLFVKFRISNSSIAFDDIENMGQIATWVRSYLASRAIFVRWRQASSDVAALDCGVPRGHRSGLCSSHCTLLHCPG